MKLFVLVFACFTRRGKGENAQMRAVQIIENPEFTRIQGFLYFSSGRFGRSSVSIHHQLIKKILEAVTDQQKVLFAFHLNPVAADVLDFIY